MKFENEHVEHMSVEEFSKMGFVPLVLPEKAAVHVKGYRCFSRKETWHLKKGEVVKTKLASWCVLNVYAQSQ